MPPFKVHFDAPEGEVRRFQLSEDGPMFQRICKKIKAVLGHDNFTVAWKDNEKDLIQVASEEEYTECTNHMIWLKQSGHLVKLYVKNAGDPQKETQVKLFVGDEGQETRRFNLEAAASFTTLFQRVKDLTGKDGFRMFWKDSDNDMVVLGSDDELAAARQMSAKGLLRVYLKAAKKDPVGQAQADTAQVPTTTQESSALDEALHNLAADLSEMLSKSEGKIGSDSEWTRLEVDSTAHVGNFEMKAAKGSEAVLETDEKNDRIESALKTLKDMGFTNEGNLLRRLLDNYNGDVARVLDYLK